MQQCPSKFSKLFFIPVLLFVYFIFANPASVQAKGLPDTGQTTCRDASNNVIDCAGQGQDGSYVGSQPHFFDNGDETISDLNTDLMWQKEDDGSNRDWATAGTYCDTLELAGHNDWRLPTIAELGLLLDASKTTPATDSAWSSAFTVPLPAGATYWTSTVAADNAANAWYIQRDGVMKRNGNKATGYFVRCVRGSSTSPNIVNHGDGTATDSNTGLMWQTAALGNMNWATAVSSCESSTVAGHNDWRLPDRNELRSIMDYSVVNPAITPAVQAFMNMGVGFHWTSTFLAANSAYAWSVNTYDGAYYFEASAKSGSLATRCVRLGPGSTSEATATLPDAPSGTSSDTSPTITVAGTDVAKYLYRLDDGTYSTATDVGTKISLSGLSEASHTLYVLGVNSLGKLQVTDTTATWSVGPAGSLSVSSNPANAATSVARDTTIVFTFSMEMETSTVDLSITYLQAADYSKSWSSDKKTLTVTFNQKLAASTKYTVSIPTTTKASDGTALASKFEASFTTKAATDDEKAEEIGGAPTRPEIEAMLDRGGASTSAINSLAADGILLIPTTITQTGTKGAATGSDSDKATACADAESFCSIVADDNMAAGFAPANTIASVKGLQANATSSTSTSPKIMTLYSSGYLPSGSTFFPKCFKANEATASTYEFSYVDELTSAKIKTAADGDDKAGFALMNPSTGAVIQSALSLPALSGGYTLLLFIRDNSRYDTNSAWGTVEDPSYLTSGQAGTDSSSSGCMLNPAAGFGLEWLMVMCFPFLVALRSRFRK